MTVREILGLSKKKETVEEAAAALPSALATLDQDYEPPPGKVSFEPTDAKPKGVRFELGKELTAGPVFRLSKQEQKIFRVTGRGSIREMRRTKRTTRTFHVPVELLETKGFEIVKRTAGELVTHPELAPILEGRERGEIYAITWIGDEKNSRYRVVKCAIAGEFAERYGELLE